MKRVSLALLGVLIAYHWLEGPAAIALPLSMFRDGSHAWLGYAAFSLLILMCVIMVQAACRSGETAAAIFYGLVMTLLTLIAATPSFDAFHIMISLLLPLMLYVYYWTLLYSGVSYWSFLHMSVPLILLLAIRYHSFGAWQKSMIIYFGAIANMHYRFLPPPIKKTARKRPTSESRWERDERRLAEGVVGAKSRVR